MHLRLRQIKVAVLACLVLFGAQAQEAPKADLPKPDHADVAYGQHPRNVFDLWLPGTGTKPSPLVIFIHGGGFFTGDKSRITAAALHEYRAAGWAVASLNYRLTDTATAPAAYLDCARALQYLRHHAAKWQLHPKRVALTGSSAGAGTPMWIAFHDDLANPKSADPISRESTRVSCAVVTNAQSSYDPRFAEKAGFRDRISIGTISSSRSMGSPRMKSTHPRRISVMSPLRRSPISRAKIRP
jgi:acetyl esterase/lipase